MTTLYTKKGRRYVVWGNLQDHDWHRKDAMRAGTFRLTYCPEDGSRRHISDVTPDTAAFAAAAAIAQRAMEQAILERAKAHPLPRESPTTPEQEAIIRKFRDDMIAAGGLMPAYWEYATAYEIAKAGVDAVKAYCHPLL